MRRNYPKNTHRDPTENYDVVYDTIPDRPDISRIIDHPRKLITINLCADPYTAMPEELGWESTCYADEIDE